jgi:flagellar biosynthesis component FlhA
MKNRNTEVNLLETRNNINKLEKKQAKRDKAQSLIGKIAQPAISTATVLAAFTLFGALPALPTIAAAVVIGGAPYVAAQAIQRRYKKTNKQIASLKQEKESLESKLDNEDKKEKTVNISKAKKATKNKSKTETQDQELEM